MLPAAASLPEQICDALAAGVGLDAVDADLIAPAELPEDERDALWLYAAARVERPRFARREPPCLRGD